MDPRAPLSEYLVYALIGAGTLLLVVALRSATAKRVEITLNDAIIAAIAVVLALVVAGKIVKLNVGPSGISAELTAAQAIREAAGRPVTDQVASLPVASVAEATKSGTPEIPRMVRDRVQGLDFILGFGGYAPEAIREYLETLTRFDFFRFVIFLEPDGYRLAGMTDAAALLALLSDPGAGFGVDGFAEALNRGDIGTIAALPGFVPATAAVAPDADKRQVLATMEADNRDWLPVTGGDGALVGIVERSRVTASLILDVTNRLDAGAAP